LRRASQAAIAQRKTAPASGRSFPGVEKSQRNGVSPLHVEHGGEEHAFGCGVACGLGMSDVADLDGQLDLL
jgi:hypothetical protein